MTSSRTSEHDPLEELRDCRNAIEVVDRRIVALLGQRVALGLRAADAKRRAGLPIVDASREAEVLRVVVDAARDEGLPIDSVRDLFERIVRISRQAQEERS